MCRRIRAPLTHSASSQPLTDAAPQPANRTRRQPRPLPHPSAYKAARCILRVDAARRGDVISQEPGRRDWRPFVVREGELYSPSLYTSRWATCSLVKRVSSIGVVFYRLVPLEKERWFTFYYVCERNIFTNWYFFFKIIVPGQGGKRAARRKSVLARNQDGCRSGRFIHT